MTGFRRDALAHFHDREYRHAYIDEFLNTSIASQIRALREQRGWTQNELATRADTMQSRISALENVNYGSWTISTLRALAEAFDVTLAVCFKSFSERIGEIERFSPSAISVPSYTDDLFLSVGAKAPPRLSNTSPLVPLVVNLAQVVAHFNAGAGPDSAPDLQQNAAALMGMVEQMYGTTSKQYREFGEWLAGLAAALASAARKRETQATAQLKEIDDEIRRRTEANTAIREAAQAAQQAIESFRAKAQEYQQSVETIRQAAEQAIQAIITGLAPIADVIAAERERIHQIAAAAAATAEPHNAESLSHNLHEVEESLLGVERGVESLVAP